MASTSDRAGESEQERDRRLRGWGEAGWRFGWDVFDTKDQYAHLGEMVADLAGLSLPEEGWLLGQCPDGWLDELRERIAEWSWKLYHLTRVQMSGTLTREDWLNVEAKYHAAFDKKLTNYEI